MKKFIFLDFAIKSFILPISMFSYAYGNMSTDLSVCATEENNNTRLICYDKIAKNTYQSDRNNSNVISESSLSNSLGKWTKNESISEIDDTKTVFLSLSAEKNVYGSYGTSATPSLILRCSENKTEAFIAWGIFINLQDTKVSVRLDKEPAKKSFWSLSTDGKATFVNNSINFIKELAKHKKLTVQVTPYSSGSVVTTFALDGIENAIKPIRETCSWK